MSFAVGEKIGTYDVLDVVKGPRIGVSYRVRNTIADRNEVLRVLPQSDKEQADRFLREIKVHSRLIHPNIVTFYHAGEIDGQLVMTTECVEGVTLEKRIDKGSIAIDEAVNWMRQVLAALSCAHEHGVVHREISPANMILATDGTVKLGGFGLAKSASDKNLTQVGTVMGWVEYMAPEQVQGVAAPDARTDIYAVGVILYELLTGRVPFICDTQFDVLLAHLTAVPRPPIELNERIPLELNAMVLMALEKDPTRRFASAKAFAEALERLSPVPRPVVFRAVEPVPEPVVVTESLENLSRAVEVDPTPTEKVEVVLPPPHEDRIDVAQPVWSMTHLIAAGIGAFIVTMILFFAVMRSL